ncbi:MAG: hypothetical protein QXU42_03010 [Thermoproteota archaeon]
MDSLRLRLVSYIQYLWSIKLGQVKRETIVQSHQGGVYQLLGEEDRRRFFKTAAICCRLHIFCGFSVRILSDEAGKNNPSTKIKKWK